VVQSIFNPLEFRGSFAVVIDFFFFAVVIDDCRHLLTMLGRATIQHVLREANAAAHALARHSSSQGFRGFWFFDPSDFLTPVIVDDSVFI
jgi:hypothetical protein